MKIIGGNSGRWVAILGVLVLTAAMAYGSRVVSINSNLAITCTNCETDLANPSGPYSLQADGAPYTDSGGVISEILTHNSVYNLDTTATLVNGLVAASTRTVNLHFYSAVEGSPLFPNDVLPSCWGGNHDQDQAVNWDIFSGHVAFTQMAVGTDYDGFARLDFNVRNTECDQQIFRFYLKWPSACIVRTTPTTWTVTSDACGVATNFGTASLYGQGGRRKQTVYYGDWRMPYQITLSTP